MQNSVEHSTGHMRGKNTPPNGFQLRVVVVQENAEIHLVSGIK